MTSDERRSGGQESEHAGVDLATHAVGSPAGLQALAREFLDRGELVFDPRKDARTNPRGHADGGPIDDLGTLVVLHRGAPTGGRYLTNAVSAAPFVRALSFS